MCFDQSSDKCMFVKIYLNLKLFNKLYYVIPGDLIIFSHLLVKAIGEVMFLESTNETEVFTAKDFKHQKFDNCRKILEDIKKDAFNENFEKWNRSVIL